MLTLNTTGLMLLFALAAGVLLWRARKQPPDMQLLLLVILAAGSGPLLRFGQITAARALALAFIAVRFSQLRGRLSPREFLPTLFGLGYGSAWLLSSGRFSTPTIAAAVAYVGYGLFGTAVATLRVDRQMVMDVLTTLAVVAVLAGATLIQESFTQASVVGGQPIIYMDGVARARGLFGDPNGTAGFVVLGIVALLSFWLFAPASQAALAAVLGGLAFLTWAMQAAASRTAMVGLACGLIPLVLVKRVVSHSRRWALLAALGLAVVAGPTLLLRGRPLDLTADDSARARLMHVGTSLSRFAGNPLVGTRDEENPYFSHNALLEVIAHGGLLGLVPFVVLHAAAASNLWRWRGDRSFVVIGAAFLAFSGVGMGISWLNNVVYWVLIGLALAWPADPDAALNALQPARRKPFRPAELPRPVA